MPKTAQREERISLRVSAQSKAKLERAAAYADKTLTDFVIDVALQKADSVVREQEVITLSPAGWEEFQRMLLHPPEPNKRLQKAFAERARVVRS
ncbi:MAG TPA: DUF1778 domain-containing protein [Stellaceae bacterium]|jgi:uncharacterized protein (DUF1778 family)|nr:DUF1778 domain-containing protein [Stellaceae bacterium]